VICVQGMAGRIGAGVMTDALTWAGTFHGIGARLLREMGNAMRQSIRLPGPSELEMRVRATACFLATLFFWDNA
jgi:superfamily I DNA/RNA helicase